MIDLLIVAAFVVYSVAAGFRARRQASQGLHEYFLAGRTVKGWKAGVSMAATQFAADTPLLVAGMIATSGIFALWRLWVYAIAFLLLAFVFSALWRRAGVLTDAELTEIRYSGTAVLPLRILKAIYYGTVFNCVVMAIVLVAAVRIAEIFLPWQAWLPAALFDPVVDVVRALGLRLGSSNGDAATASALISILLIVGFTALYATTGGLRSVIATDVVQFALMMAGMLAYAVFASSSAGGLEAMASRVVALYPVDAAQLLAFAPPSGELLLPFVAIVSLQWVLQINSDGTGYLAQRSMACATDREARIAALVFTWLQWLARSLLWLVIAVALLVIYPFTPEQAGSDGFAASREILFATGIAELLPTGVRGLLLTAMLAALASTIDTHLNWGASYWSNDIYRRLVCEAWRRRSPSDRELVYVARASNVLVLALALMVMARLESIHQAWTVSLLFGAGMGPTLVLRWLWERINVHSEIAAITVSLGAAPVLLWSVETEWIRLAAIGTLTTVAAVAVACVTPRTDARTLQRFFVRVRPPGFWSATAAAVGVAPGLPRRALASSLVTLTLCVLSLYLLLIGAAMLLLPGRPADAPVLAWLSVAAGAALVPAWWRRALAAETDGA